MNDEPMTWEEHAKVVATGLHECASDCPLPPLRPEHTIGHRTIGPGNSGEYGRRHDMDCPGCVDTPYTLSPRSETYWAS